jgi:hypothetical protein
MAVSENTTALAPLQFTASEFGTGFVFLTPRGTDAWRRRLRIHVTALLKRDDLLRRLFTSDVQRLKTFASNTSTAGLSSE